MKCYDKIVNLPSFIRFVILILVVGPSTSLLCQNTSRLYFNHITQSDGLSQTWNQYCLQDSKGFVWISSLNGLNRYDGRSVKSYKYNPSDSLSLPDNYIQSDFIEDKNSDIWFTTYTALVRYNRKHDNFEKSILNIPEKKINGYQLVYKTSVGELGVVVNGTKLYHYNIVDDNWVLQYQFPSMFNDFFPQFNISGTLKNIIAYNRDDLGMYIFNFDNKEEISFTRYFFEENPNVPSFRVMAVKEGNEGVLWIANSKGLLKFQNKNSYHQYRYKSKVNNFKDLAFYDVEHLDETNLILSSTTMGLVLVNKSNPEHISIPKYKGLSQEEQKLAYSNTRNIYVSKTGVVWANINLSGTDFTNISKVKFDFKDLSLIWDKANITKGITSICQDRTGDFWYANRSNGVFRTSSKFEPKQYFNKDNSSINNIPSNLTHYLLIDHLNRCWTFSYEDILTRYDSTTMSFRTIANKSYLYGIVLANDQLVFSPMDGGLEEYMESSGHSMFRTIDSTKSHLYTRLYQNNKGLLFAARNLTNIDILDPDMKFKAINSLNISGDILSFSEDTSSNTMWIGTSNGLVKLDQSTWKWKTFTEADGMSNHNIYAILIDEKALLWLSTNRGIIKFDPISNSYHNFDLPDGLQGYEYNRNANLVTSSGLFVFGGTNGLTYFHPEKLRYIETVPIVQFTHLEIEDGAIPIPACDNTGATNISEIEKIVLDYSENTLKFEFAALEFSNPDKNLYKYRLSPIEDTWVDNGVKSIARYPNLLPGNYTFEVKAANSDGFWSEPKNMMITITPPFWQTWWFRLIMALLIVGIGYTIIRAYIRDRIRKQEFLFEKQELILKNELQLQQERNRIADELHDELGGKLSTIKFAGKKVQRANNIEEIKEITTRVGEISTELIDSMRSIIWAMDSHNDTLASLLANIRNYGSTLARDNDFNIEFDFLEQETETVVKGQIRHHVYLIIKELLHNFLKHSTGDHIMLNILEENNQLLIVFSENGEGYNPLEQMGKGKGLKSIQKRVKLLNATITYDTDITISSSIIIPL